MMHPPLCSTIDITTQRFNYHSCAQDSAFYIWKQIGEELVSLVTHSPDTPLYYTKCTCRWVTAFFVVVPVSKITHVIFSQYSWEMWYHTLTSHSNILWVAIAGDGGTTWALIDTSLITMAINTFKVDWTNSSTKISIAEGFCTCRNNTMC